MSGAGLHPRSGDRIAHRGHRPLRTYRAAVRKADGTYVHMTLDQTSAHEAIEEATRLCPAWQLVRVEAEGRSGKQWIAVRCGSQP